MSIITKQLILNQLGLTTEIIEIIKEYIFYDVILKTKKIKNEIISLINNTYYTPLHIIPPLSDIQYVFYIDGEDSSAQFQNDFCIKCGNYIVSYDACAKIICNCPSP